VSIFLCCAQRFGLNRPSISLPWLRFQFNAAQADRSFRCQAVLETNILAKLDSVLDCLPGGIPQFHIGLISVSGDLHLYFDSCFEWFSFVLLE